MSEREQDYAESSDGDGRPGLPIDPLRLWLILKRSWQIVVAAGVIGAFVGAAITGGLMFIGNATTYAANTPFLIKMGLLVLAGLNMLYFQFVTYRSVGQWDSGRPVPAARAAGMVSLVLWVGVIGFGRWIGFV